MNFLKLDLEIRGNQKEFRISVLNFFKVNHPCNFFNEPTFYSILVTQYKKKLKISLN